MMKWSKQKSNLLITEERDFNTPCIILFKQFVSQHMNVICLGSFSGLLEIDRQITSSCSTPSRYLVFLAYTDALQLHLISVYG